MQQHGGDVQGYIQKYGKTPLDFSANVNPLGVPLGVRQAIEEAILTCDRYPDPNCTELVRAICNFESQRHQNVRLETQQVLCTAGAISAIYRVTEALQPKVALLVTPTFSEYRAALRRVGCTDIRSYTMTKSNDFWLTQGMLKKITEDVDVLYLCNPNNPTGRTVEPGLMQQIITRCSNMGVTLVVDECFLDFVEGGREMSITSRLDIARKNKHCKLVVIKAFTKIFAMAGLRLGYCMSNDLNLMRRMRQDCIAWEVSSLAQQAGVAALAETEYLQKTVATVGQAREKMIEGMRKLGIGVIPSEANFILFTHPDAELSRRMALRGIMVRDCARFEGLTPGYFRVAVREEQQNRVLLAALTEMTPAAAR